MTLAGYQYRKSIEITTAESVSDLQIPLNLYRDDGYDTGSDLYLNNRCKSNYDDIRFTLDGSDVLLPYYIEDTTADPALCWVKIPALSSTATTILVYFGNPTAASAASGTDTFEFFDDFSSDLSKWNVVGSPTVAGGVCTINTATTSIISKTVFGVNRAVKVRRSTTSVNYANVGFASAVGALTKNVALFRHGSSTGYAYSYNASSGQNTSIGSSYGGGTYRVAEIKRNNGTSNVFSIDGGDLATHTTYVSTADLGVFVSTITGTPTINIDWIFVTKIPTSAPVVSPIGEEFLIFPSFESVYDIVKVTKSFQSIYSVGRLKSFESIYTTKIASGFVSPYKIKIYAEFISTYQILLSSTFDTEIKMDDLMSVVFRTRIESQIGTIASRVELI